MADSERTEADVTPRDRMVCFMRGHDVRSWGTMFGWCHRCQHSVWAYDGKKVLYRGEYHRYPPAHVELTPAERDAIAEVVAGTRSFSSLGSS